MNIPEFEGDPLEVKRMKFLYGLLLAGRLNLNALKARHAAFKEGDPPIIPQHGVHYGSWSETQLAAELERNGLCSSNLLEITDRLIHKMQKQRPEIVSDWDTTRSGVLYHEYTIAKDFTI